MTKISWHAHFTTFFIVFKKIKNKNKKLNLVVVYLVNIDYVVNDLFWYNMIKKRTKLINKITSYRSTIYDLSYWEQIRIDHSLSNFYNGPTIWRKKNKIEKCIFHNKLHFHYYLNITLEGLSFVKSSVHSFDVYKTALKWIYLLLSIFTI